LQLAQATAAIAARGERFQPSMVKATRDPVTGKLTPRTPQKLAVIELTDSAHWDQIIAGMRGVIYDASGTAQALSKDAPWPIAGKSGTAQVFTVAQNTTYDEMELKERMRDHALFIAFAPIEQPRIAVAVIVENGNSGSGVAGPVARQVIDAYLGSPTS
jgi:penicillin-binding protein 2